MIFCSSAQDSPSLPNSAELTPLKPDPSAYPHAVSEIEPDLVDRATT